MLQTTLKPSKSLDPTRHGGPRTCLIITIATLELLLLALCLSFLRTQQHQFLTLPTTTLPLRPSTNKTQSVTSSISKIDQETPQDHDCPLGRVYVYDLPPAFNQDILNSCDELNPWSSSCEVLTNNGFGKPATELNGVVPDSLLPAWYWTDQFALELIFHKRVLKHRCRTLDPESATAFYIPFYAGLAVGKHLWSRFDFNDRDRHCGLMLEWVHQQRFWNRSLGWDHFLTMGRITWDFRRSKDPDWGSSCVYMPLMRNITRLLIERNPWDYFDVAVPYPTGFHPRTVNDVAKWQDFVRGRNRSTLFSFVGAKRGKFRDDFRSLLLHQCTSGSRCRVVDCSDISTKPCSNGSAQVLTAFLDSEFCLQPRGDSFTRRSIFDCMIAGSIPVFFWRRTAYLQYEWFLPSEPSSYSVFIDRGSVKNGSTTVKSVLEKLSRVEVGKMREKVIEFIPRLLYSKPDEGLGSGVKDAFDVAIDGVLKRIKDQETGYKWR